MRHFCFARFHHHNGENNGGDHGHVRKTWSREQLLLGLGSKRLWVPTSTNQSRREHPFPMEPSRQTLVGRKKPSPSQILPTAQLEGRERELVWMDICIFIRLFPGSLKARDRRGWAPFNLAVAFGAPLKIIKIMVGPCPESLVIADNEGVIPRDLAALHSWFLLKGGD